MIIVTGGAGFIGRNIIQGLNKRGENRILVVDNLENGYKYRNLLGCDIYDFMDKRDFLARVQKGESFGKVEAIYHEGACSSTTEWDGHYMMENNYEYSKILLAYCQKNEIPFLYASSAAVYGGSDTFVEELKYEAPLNVYGYSKYLFDQWVRRIMPTATSQIAGFRYFNVYGPGEQHKGSMASVAYHFNNQIKDNGICNLFAGCDGYADGEQLRDFVYVEDVADVNLWFLDNPDKSGIFNLGTGRSQAFNDVAKAVVAWHGKGEMNYIPFPDHLKGAYQSFTEANIDNLRRAGYEAEFHSVEQGVKKYMDILNA